MNWFFSVNISIGAVSAKILFRNRETDCLQINQFKQSKTLNEDFTPLKLDFIDFQTLNNPAQENKNIKNLKWPRFKFAFVFLILYAVFQRILQYQLKMDTFVPIST